MTAADLARVDRPAERQRAAHRLRSKLAPSGLIAEQQHLLDPVDGAFAVLACTHPEACSCDADYGSEWAAWLAARIEMNEQHGGTA